MRSFLFILLLCFLSACKTQPKTASYPDVQIARDAWGVPHILGNTDADVAYGLAWAQCEDDFVTLQELMAACKGMLGEIKGKDGLVVDFGVQYMGLQEIAQKKYKEEVTGPFKVYLESFVDGVNNYAVIHPTEVVLDGLFPLKGEDIIVGYLLGNMEVSHAGQDLVKILNGTIGDITDNESPKGSNAFAFSSKKTSDGKTYLAINSHQPLEGWYSWYEAHLISNEGMNVLGGTFAGGICIFHGVNEKLGWAHTVNHGDFSDVYQLEMHPEKPLHYRFDGEWLPLKEKTYTSWLKVAGPIKIPISRTIYESHYGPTFETEKGFYSWRFVVGTSIKMAEQWYMMNKAQNFTAFKNALKMRGITSLNIVYADVYDTIYYVSNGRIPKRNPHYNWSGVLPGNVSETLWDTQLIPFDSLPQVLNPKSGWVFNTNNTPYSSSDKIDNPKETKLNALMGFQPTGMENNRSTRFLELIQQYDSVSYTDFKKIKYDQQYPAQMNTRTARNLEIMMHLNAQKYPEIADAIHLLTTWDRKTDASNTTAALYILSWMHLDEKRKAELRAVRGGIITEEDAVYGIRKAKEELLQRYGSLEIPLGKLQRHTRAKVSLPIGGAPDVLAAIYSKKQPDGTYRATAGESYIELVRFSKEGVEIESVNSYGASSNPKREHYTSQMGYFTSQKLKKMELSIDSVLKNAVHVYKPLRVVQ